MSAISGASAKILVNDTVVGRATGVSATESIEQIPISILGDIDVVEHEAVARRVNVSADFVRMRESSLVAQGIFPAKSGNPDDDTATVVNFPEMTWLIYDHVNDIVLWRIEGVVPGDRSWRVDQGSIMTTNATLRARKMYDEQNN